MRRTNFPAGHQGNLDAADGKGGSHRIKKTSGKSQGTLRVACVRWRDASVALPDTLTGKESPRRLIR